MNIDVSTLTEMGPAALLLLVLNIVGMVLKTSPLPNKWIPLVLLILGGAVYPWICDYTTVVSNNPTAIAVLYGVAIGGAAVGVHQGLKAFQNEKPE